MIYVCTPLIGIPAEYPDAEHAIADAVRRVYVDGLPSCRVYEEENGAQPEPTFRRILTVIGPDEEEEDE